MPRNGSGTFSLAAGNPVVPGTVIDSTWANDTLEDIANEITNSLSRTGAGGMLAPFRVADGTVTAPGLAFTNETNTGIYRAGSGELWFTVGGVAVAQITANGLLLPSGRRISLPAPVNDADAANKEYVDDRVDPVIQYANYYLGPKASDPTTNNSGGALVAGTTYWSTSQNQLRVYNGSIWEPMPATASLVGQTFSGTGAQTNFTLANPSGPAVNLEVFISGVRQVPTTDYTVSGTTLTFTVAPPTGTNNIFVRFAQLIAMASVDAQQVSYLPASGPVTNVQDRLRSYEASGGSALIGYTPAGTGAVATNVQSKLREFVSVKDFGAVGDGVADDTAAIQAAIDYVATIGPTSVGGIVYVPEGEYRITSTIISAPTGGQVGIRGAGQFSTIFKPDGDFTAIWLRSAYLSSGDFSVEWPVTAAASIPTTRIGVEFAGPDNQTSYVDVEKITVMYAYRGFVQRNWTGQPLGNVFLSTFRQLTAFRCADYGFHFDSKTGSTTTIFEQCYVRADDSLNQPYGKGFFLNNIEDIQFQQVAIDKCLNAGVLAQNYFTFTSNSLALEANSLTTSGAILVTLNGSRNVLNGVKVAANNFDTGAKANVIRFGGNALRSTVRGYVETNNTVVAGTTLYGVSFNAAGTRVYVPDESVAFAGIDNNGWFANLVYGDKRVTTTNLAPNYGTWERGDIVFNRSPSAAGKIGHVCVTAGSPGTWKPWGAIDA